MKRTMTLEEFKQQFDPFDKLTTPAGIIFCQQQYEAHLISIEDNNFFEPVTERAEGDFGSIYEKRLHAILNFNLTKEDQLYFLVQPSFEAEHLLIIENSGGTYALRHYALKANYWQMLYENPALTTADKTISEGFLNKTLGDQIFKLVDRSMKAAKKPVIGLITLDGVLYKMSKIVGNQRIDVKKHSPIEGSTSARIISLLETVIALTKPNSIVDVERELALKLDLLNSE